MGQLLKAASDLELWQSVRPARPGGRIGWFTLRARLLEWNHVHDPGRTQKNAITNSLRNCQLFTGLPQPDLEKIAEVSVVKSLEKGDYLFHEGDVATGFYVIQRGAMNIHRATPPARSRSSTSFAAENRLPRRRWRRRPAIPPTRARWNPRRCCWCKRRGFWNCSSASRNLGCGCSAR